MTEPIALDVSLEKARALHRVWRALNDGDCPKCHFHRPASHMHHFGSFAEGFGIECPACRFKVTGEEIHEIEKLFAPAMDAAVAIFEEWRASRLQGSDTTDTQSIEREPDFVPCKCDCGGREAEVTGWVFGNPVSGICCKCGMPLDLKEDAADVA